MAPNSSRDRIIGKGVDGCRRIGDDSDQKPIKVFYEQREDGYAIQSTNARPVVWIEDLGDSP